MKNSENGLKKRLASSSTKPRKLEIAFRDSKELKIWMRWWTRAETNLV